MEPCAGVDDAEIDFSCSTKICELNHFSSKRCSWLPEAERYSETFEAWV